MPKREVFCGDAEMPECKIRIACECYSDPDLVSDALRLPNFGKLDWRLPCTPEPFKLIDAELVLIVCDQDSLLMAIGRSRLYKLAGRAHLLIYLRDGLPDEAGVPDEVIPGLALPRLELHNELFKLTLSLLEPVLWQGFVGIDWGDARNLLTMDGLVVMEKAFSTRQPEEAIKRAVSQLQARVAGRAIQGLQAAIFSNGTKMPMKSISDLSWACKDGLPLSDKDSDGCDTYFIVAAPILDYLDDDYYEVRLFARVECTGAHWPNDLLLELSD